MTDAPIRKLEHPDGSVTVEPLGDGRLRIKATLNDASAWAPNTTCETSYPIELISSMLANTGPAWLCDEIRRDEDPDGVERSVRMTLLGHVERERFAGARLLDFGCGRGSSTAVLARLLPELGEIVGVELDEELIEIARLRAEHYGAQSLSFHASPAPDRLPPDLGTFDFIYLSAVWEHLLPDERQALPRLLWSVLRPGGVLFVTETPHRWSPVETHSTGLPLINYLPPALAGPLARRSPQVDDDESWDRLLRNGLRGGTVREVLRILSSAGDGEAVLLEPLPGIARSEEELWYEYGSPSGKRRLIRVALTALNRTFSTHFFPYLNLAIEKR